MPTKKQISKKDDERLSQLIRLKRSEKPDDAFWEKFDADLHSRQLSALVETHTWYARTGKLSMLLAKKSAAIVATGGALVITFLAINPIEFSKNTTEQQGNSVLSDLASEDSISDQPLFVIEPNNDSLNPFNTETVFPISDLSIPTTYSQNILSSEKKSNHYNLNTDPKTFFMIESRQDFSNPNFGAKVIRANPAN